MRISTRPVYHAEPFLTRPRVAAASARAGTFTRAAAGRL
jgi:hypothetical protein